MCKEQKLGRILSKHGTFCLDSQTYSAEANQKLVLQGADVLLAIDAAF
jgi:hypothetical protein